VRLGRRKFVKTAAVLSGAAAIGLQAEGRVLNALVARAAPQAGPAGQTQTEKVVTVFTPCAGCHQKCVLSVHVADGRITKAEAAPFPDQPEDTHCCLKGVAAAALPYYPDRLKFPVKRAGARGEGKWERITWEEALDTIAQKLIETRDRYGSRAVLIDHTGSSVSPQAGDVNSGAEALRFENLFGSTLPDGWFDDTACVVSNFFFSGQDVEASDPRGMMHSKLIIVWGANPAESAYRDWKQISLARQNGAKLIVIGPLFDPTAAKADEWVPVRRATDAALALAMIQVIVEEGLHDQAYLRQKTVAPLLVRDDNGLLLREADITSGGSNERFVAWDEAAGKPFVVDKGQTDVPATLALMGSFKAGGIACHTAFQKLVDTVNEGYKPEQVVELTGVPAEKIRELALRYVQAQPAAIYYNFGLGRYYNGHLSTSAMLTLGAVCGYIGRLGGGVSLGGISIPGAGGGYLIGLNNGAVQQATDATLNIITLFETLQAIETGKPYPIKMWINSYRNPIQCCPNPQRWIEKIVPNLDFIVNINIRLDWTAEYADIVLPDATIFERLTVSAARDHVILSGPAIEPLFEARTTNWMWSELAKRVGLGEYFQSSDEDYVRMVLTSDDPSLEGITLEKLRESGGIMRANVPAVPYVANQVFDTPTGRAEFYCERLVEYGQALPVYMPSKEAPESGKYPLQYYSCRKKYYMHTFMGDIPVLKKLMGEPWVDINPDDAKARGIADGDLVEIFNDRGRLVVRALLNPMVPPGSVRTNHGPGPHMYKAGHYQMLTLPHAAEETFNPVFDRRYRETRPWWKWAGGQADIIFDCAVDVRKA